MLNKTSRFPNILMIVIIIILSLFSFQTNGLRVVKDINFERWTTNIDSTILDGILHSKLTGSPPTVGRYTRPWIATEREHYLNTYNLFEAHEHSGEFAEYRSAFGLSIYLFYFIHKTFNASVSAMYFVNSALLALTVALFFIALRKEFSFWGSAAFSAVLFTSPWLVLYARNLFFMESSFFYPTLATLFLGKATITSPRTRYILTAILFFCYLIKLLCGLDFITTIFISSFAVSMYFCLKYGNVKTDILPVIITQVASVLFAILIAVSLQSIKVSANYVDGIKHILSVVEKNTSSSDPLAAATLACSEKYRQIERKEDCIDQYVRSMKASTVSVVGGYFIFQTLLPWEWTLEPSLNSEIKTALKFAVHNRSLPLLYHLIASNKFSDILPIYLTLGQTALFLLYLFILGIKIFSSSTPWHWRGLILLSFVAPLSWFILAKANSYIHYEINYLLWYLCFIPFSVLFFIESWFYKSSGCHDINNGTVIKT